MLSGPQLFDVSIFFKILYVSASEMWIEARNVSELRWQIQEPIPVIVGMALCVVG